VFSGTLNPTQSSWDYPGDPVPEENLLLDFCGAGEDNRAADTLTIRMGATPSRLISDPPSTSPHFYALPATNILHHKINIKN